MSDYQKFIEWLEKTYPAHARAYSGDPVIQSAFFAGMAKCDDAHKRMFESACVDLAMINECLGLDPECGGAAPIIHAIKELKHAMQRAIDAWETTSHQKNGDARLWQCMEDMRGELIAPQLRKIHPLDFPIEIFIADLSTRAANVIRLELGSFDSSAGTGMYDIEPPYTVRHLCMYSRSEMRKWPNFGKNALMKLRKI